MVRTGHAIGVLVAAAIMATSAPAAAEVLDAVYRGTLVCDKLPFTRVQMREAIDVTISGGAGYVHTVRLRDRASGPGEGRRRRQRPEHRSPGIVERNTRQYEAKYSGVRVAQRPAQGYPKLMTALMVTRACSGASWPLKRSCRATNLRRDDTVSGALSRLKSRL